MLLERTVAKLFRHFVSPATYFVSTQTHTRALAFLHTGTSVRFASDLITTFCKIIADS